MTVLGGLATGLYPSPEPLRGQQSLTQLVLLGTGTPNSEPDRSGSALAIIVNGTPYLVDAGPGVVRRANAAYQMGIEGLAMPRLATVFLTHLHTDHTLGLPDLIFTPWVLERETPLRVFGPAGTEAMVHHISEAFQADIQVRLQGSEPANEAGYKTEVREIEAGIVYRDENVTVTAFRVQHGSWSHAFGYRFDTPDRSIVISGDTMPIASVAESCMGCDILVHEVYCHATFQSRPAVWQRYHSSSHTSGLELGRIAQEANPGLLVLTHQLLWGAEPAQLLSEVRTGFTGRVVYGKDLDVF